MNTLFKTVTNSDNKKSVIPFQQFEDLEHLILIEGLTIEMSIGVLTKEHQAKQNVIIDIELMIEPKDSYEENIHNTVCYSEIIKNIEVIAGSKHFKLVETFAEDIATLCLNHAISKEVKVSVRKPDIISNTQAVGFTLKRIKN